MVRREVQVSAARMDQVRATAAFDTRGLIAGQGSGVSAIALPRQLESGPRGGMSLEPGLTAQGLTETRAVSNKIDMALEMLDVNSMDTGRYRAMVIQDAKDRQNLKGFIKFAQVMSASAVAAGTVFDIKGGMTSGHPPSLGQKHELDPRNALTGYFVKGRLAGVSSYTEWGWMNERYGGDSTRQLQMAVNIIIYALTQEGSMTQRLMQMVN